MKKAEWGQEEAAGTRKKATLGPKTWEVESYFQHLVLCSMLRYVLLHHVMGGLEGVQGTWGYVQGGMGALSDAIASSATVHGASIFTDKVSTSPPLIVGKAA